MVFRKQITKDEHGDHSLTCLNGGYRTHMHHDIVRQVHIAASQALLRPTLEPVLADLGGEGTTRADLIMPSLNGDGSRLVIDVAVTHISYANTHHQVKAAAAAPGGAAELYEQVKVKRYAEPLARLNARSAALYAAEPRTAPLPAIFRLRPLVVDTHGAWSPNALETLKTIGRAWGRRMGSRLGNAVLHHRLSFALIRNVARVLLDSSAADHLPPLDVQRMTREAKPLLAASTSRRGNPFCTSA